MAVGHAVGLAVHASVNRVQDAVPLAELRVD